MIETAQQIGIRPVGPFSWDAALDMMEGWAPVRRHRRAPGVTRIAFPLDGDFTPVAVALRFEDGELRGEAAGTERLGAVARQVARIFSLDHDGTGFAALAGQDPAFGRVMAELPGLRPVCFSSPYEAAAWAILSARISMAQAAVLQDRLLAEHGHRLRVAGAEVRAFPEPERLLQVTALPGLTSEKVARLHGVARAALDGVLDAERLRALGDVAGPASVRAIRGIGEFWSQGVYLRACGIVDVFPDEPRAAAALGRLHGLESTSPDALRELTDRLRPYRMWACFLIRVAAGRGLIRGYVPASRSTTGARASMNPSATET